MKNPGYWRDLYSVDPKVVRLIQRDAKFEWMVAAWIGAIVMAVLCIEMHYVATLYDL